MLGGVFGRRAQARLAVAPGGAFRSLGRRGGAGHAFTTLRERAFVGALALPSFACIFVGPLFGKASRAHALRPFGAFLVAL